MKALGPFNWSPSGHQGLAAARVIMAPEQWTRTQCAVQGHWEAVGFTPNDISNIMNDFFGQII